jgi:hypothetical protein
MTISSTSNKAQFNGSGTTGPFAFTFKVFDEGDLTVIKTDPSEVDTTLTITTDYTVSLNADQNNNPGGTVTTVATVANGYKLTVLREVDALQETDITNGGGFYPEVIENALDRLTMLAQQNAEQLERAALVPIGSTYVPSDLVDDLITLAGIEADISTVAGISGNVTTVAGIAANVTTVAGINANVTTVAGISGNVTTVAGISADVTTAASNIAAIIDAPNQAAAAAASYDAFDDRYLGDKVADPALDNDGDALLEGALYWNSVSKKIRVYNGVTWGDVSASTSFNSETFSGTGAQTAFTLASSPGAVDALMVYISGIRQVPTTDYTLSGTTLTFAVAPPAGTNNILTIGATAQDIGTPSDGTVTLAKLDASIYGTSGANKLLQLDSSGKLPALDGSQLTGISANAFKNKIIGGDFTTNPWQRGTSFTALAADAYSADRWRYSNNTTVVLNALKTADAPTADQAGVFTQHCLHIDVTTADASIAVGEACLISQRVEGFNAASFGFGQSGTRYVTLSFWHKHTKTGTYCVALRNSAQDRSYVAEYTQDVTDTWEKAVVTFPVDTSGTWLYDSGLGLQVNFSLAIGWTFQTTANAWQAGNFLATANQVNALDSTANNFKIALVQLEAGSVATPFEHRPYGTELALCQRYYYRINPSGSTRIAVGFCSSTSNLDAISPFPVPMRTAPSALEQTGTAGDYGIVSTPGTTPCTVAPAFFNADIWMATTRFTHGTTLTLGHAGHARATTSAGYLGWSAEL